MSLNEVSEIICEVMDDDSLEVTEVKKLNEDLGLCSYDMMLILGIIEERYNKTVDLDILLSDMTVKGLLAAVGN